MAKINIGLDIGIASVGWAVVNSEKFEIIDAGSRLFNEANNDKNGTTASTRRENRGKRRGFRRDSLRREDLKKLFVKQEWLKSANDFHLLSLKNKNVYETKLFGIENKLSVNELMIVLFHYLKNRGIFSWEDELIENLEEDPEKKETELIEKKDDPRTVSEIQLENLKNWGEIHGSKNKFTHEQYLKEINNILAKQKEFGTVDDKFIEDYLNIFNRKREFYEGPGNGSTFGWDQDEEKFYNQLLGFDTYDQNEPRASKVGVYANIFNLLNDLNGLKINDVKNRETEKLSKEEKEKIFNSILNNSDGSIKKITLPLLAKILNVQKEDITGYRIDKKDKAVFTSFDSLSNIYNKLNKKGLDTRWINNQPSNLDLLDKIVEICTITQSFKTRKEKLLNLFQELDKIHQIPFESSKIPEIANEIAFLSFSGSHSLSNKTIKKAIPFMWEKAKQGNVVIKDDLKLTPQYNFFSSTSSIIPLNKKMIEAMYISPVVKRSFIQALKVVRAIQKRDKDWEIENIFIELAREKNSEDQKKFIKNNQKKDEMLNNEIMKSFSILESTINKKTRKKLRLLIEQGGKCAYCLEDLEWDKVQNWTSYTEIDHIIPESISFSSSLDNLVLVHSQENHEKSNQTPYSYFNRNQTKISWNTFRDQVKKNLYSDSQDKGLFSKKYIERKINNLLDEKDYSLIENREDFIARNLNDTRYATTAIKEYLEEWKHCTNSTIKIKTINGSFTDYIKRNYFNLPPKNRDEFQHHAIDAIAIAYSDWIKNKKISMNDWSEKRDEILNFNFRFSWMCNKNYNKQITNETIYSYKKFDGNEDWIKIEKIDLFTLDKVEKLSELFTKDQDKVLMKQSDPLTFDKLQKIYNEYKNLTYIDEKTKKNVKVKNPFIYARDIEKIEIVKEQNHKQDVKIPIKTLRYKSDKIGKYLDLSQKYKDISENKKVVLESFKPLRVDVFKNKLTGKLKGMSVNVADVTFINDQGMELNEVTYNQRKNELKINDSYELLISAYPGDIVNFVTAEKNFIARIVGCKENSNSIEYKYLHRNKTKEEKSQIYQGLAKVLDLSLINIDFLGIQRNQYVLE